MENKSLQIEQAVQGESLATKTLASYQEFHNELKLYNQVDDVFSDSRVKIKKDQGKYIFNINGINKFNVDTPVLEEWLNKFYDDKKIADQWKAEEEAHVRIEGLEITYLKSKTKEELDALMTEVQKTEEEYTLSTNPENVKYQVQRLITFYEQEKDLANESISRFEGHQYDRKDRGLRKLNKIEIKRRLEELEKIKKQIERLEANQGKKYSIKRKNNGEFDDVEVKMDDINAFDMKTTLHQLDERIDVLAKEAPEFIKTRNEVILENGDTTPYYEFIVNNVQDATQLKLALNKINNDYITLNKMSLTDAKRQALQQDLKRLQEYLQNYENNPNAPLEPFIPLSGEAFNELRNTEPRLQRFGKLNKKAGKAPTGDMTKNPSGYPYYEEVSGGTGDTTNGENNQKAGSEYIPSDYGTAREAFEKGGIGGIMNHFIDKTNMQPHQKQFRGGVGNIAVTGGMIFVGWKMLSSAWGLLMGKHKGDKDAKRKARGWLLGPAPLVFGAQARSGQGPTGLLTGGALTEKISGIFGGKKGKENENGTPEENEITLKYKEGFPGATAVFNGLNYGEMKQFLIQDGDKMKIDPNKYDEFVELYKNGSKKNEAGAKFLESIGKDDNRSVIDLALTGMGITRADIQNDANSDKEFNKAASESIVRLRSVSEFMDQKGYNTINPETTYLVEEYIRSGEDLDELEDLEARGDVFYKETEIVDKTGLHAKITTLAAGDKKKEEELLRAINTFYEKMPNADKNIDIIGTWPVVKFKTYGQETTINLEKKSMDGFTPSRFTSYFELFKAANLTNRIQDICKDKLAIATNPFYINTINGNIVFNDAETVSTQFDTNVVDGGRRGTLQEISPTLEQYKSDYVTYLNGIRNRQVKPEETEKLDTLPTVLASSLGVIVGSRPEKAEILKGMQQFYTNMPSADKDIELIGAWPVVKFKTYEQEVSINLETKVMEGFSASRFADYHELFKAANLTNYIKMITKDKSSNANDGKPFYIGGTSDIIFNDESTRSLSTDTRIISGGRGGTLKGISPTLEDNKTEYVAFLNTIRDRTDLRDKVRSIVGSDLTKERELIAALNIFHDQMPNADKVIDISGTRTNLTFTTYGENTTINMQNKSIIGFTPTTFPDSVELLKAASLTNRIKDIFKDKKASSSKPFEISSPGGDIEYDGKLLRERDLRPLKGVRDVEAISAGMRGSLNKISPTLENNKQAYVDYLNSLSRPT